MKKTVLFLMLSAVTIGTMAKSPCSSCAVRFVELPYAEGTIYVSVSEGDKNIVLSSVEIEADSVSMQACLCEYIGKNLSVKAFQDLNDNGQLDFDGYGRPTEPCLQAVLTPCEGEKTYTFRLIEY